MIAVKNIDGIPVLLTPRLASFLAFCQDATEEFIELSLTAREERMFNLLVEAGLL